MSPGLLFAGCVPFTVKPAAWEPPGRGRCWCVLGGHAVGLQDPGREHGGTSESLKAHPLAFLGNLAEAMGRCQT